MEQLSVRVPENRIFKSSLLDNKTAQKTIFNFHSSYHRYCFSRSLGLQLHTKFVERQVWVRTGQDRTGQDRPGQDRIGQAKTEQDRTEQARTGQVRTGQDRTGQARPRQNRTG